MEITFDSYVCIFVLCMYLYVIELLFICTHFESAVKHLMMLISGNFDRKQTDIDPDATSCLL